MKIGTYNLHNLYDIGASVNESGTEIISEAFFTKRIAYFIEKFHLLNLDIICLQEVGGEHGVSLIGDALGYDYFFAKPNKRGIRMAVLYKKELASRITCESVGLGELYFPSILERGDTSMLKPISQRRDILEMILKVEEKTVSISTFHLKSNLPQYLEGDDIEHDSQAYVDAKWRCVLYKMMELRAIREHATKRIKEGKEVMLLGDYNENNTASIMDILKGSQEDTFRLEDLLKGHTKDVTTHYHRRGKLTFDTILVSQGLLEKVVSVHVENKDLADCSMLPLEAEVIGSDHALVFADMVL